MFTSFLRIFKFAIKDFTRNKGISLASIFIISTTILLLTGLLFIHGMIGFLANQINNKIDITAYFTETSQEGDILSIQEKISGFNFVKKIEYISKQDALELFKEKYKNNEYLSDALIEVGGDPFLPYLSIITSGNPNDYLEISELLKKDEFKNIINNVDFSEKQEIINRVFSVKSTIIKTGLILSLILIIIAILVVFNTIKLTVDNLKEEISTMKIVGASSWFIKGPFLIQGSIYGIISFIVCFIISFFVFYFINSKILIILPEFSSFNYFIKNIWIFIFLQLGFGIFVGITSSYFAIKKYLKI